MAYGLKVGRNTVTFNSNRNHNYGISGNNNSREIDLSKIFKLEWEKSGNHTINDIGGVFTLLKQTVTTLKSIMYILKIKYTLKTVQSESIIKTIQDKVITGQWLEIII